MADDGLRALERRYRDTGAVDDHARWIAARVRVGELSEHRARLAADLGHAAARLAMGEPPVRALEDIALSFHNVCRATRAPAAHSEAHWVLTGEQASGPTSTEAPLDDDALAVRVALAMAHAAQAVISLDGEWRRGLERLEAWLRCPCDHHLLGPTWTPVLSRDEVLVAVMPEAREAVAQHIGVAEVLWLQGQHGQAVIAWPGVDLWAEIIRASWAWLDVEFDLERESDFESADYVSPGPAVVRALAGSTRGTVMLATCAALHACAGGGMVAVRVAAKAAVRAAGEATIRAAIVRDVGPWLLREEP